MRTSPTASTRSARINASGNVVEGEIELDGTAEIQYDGHPASRCTITLKNGETLEIDGILVGTHYVAREYVNNVLVPKLDSNTEATGIFI